MIGRPLWFVAGAGAGVYATLRARRLAQEFTPEGVTDRVRAAGLGARLLREEVVSGQREKDTELRTRWGLLPHGRPELTGTDAEQRGTH